MPNINVTPQKMTRGNGLNPTVTNLVATDVYFIENDGTVFLEFNGDATTARNVTIVTTGSIDGNAVADLVVPIPATAKRMWGLIPTDVYNNAGKVSLTVDGAGVKLFAYRL